MDESAYMLKEGNENIELSISESKEAYDSSVVPTNKKENMTKAIFSNESILEQLRDAKENGDDSLSY